MKILHIITSLRTGGAEKLMVDLLPRLKEMGYQIDLLLLDGTDTPFRRDIEGAGINVYDLGKGGSVYSPIKLLKLIPFLKKYDIVHTHNTASQLFAAIGSIIYKSILCTTEHNTTNRRRNWKWYTRIDRWMYNRYQHIIAISDQTKLHLKTYLRDLIPPITTIPNGIDTSKYNSSSTIRLLPNMNNCTIKIMQVAGFRQQKDQDTTIKSLLFLPETYHLFLVGDGVRRKELQDLVKDLNLINRVHFLGIRTDVDKLLKSSDIVVMSSHWEGFGLSAVEGMAAGKPVIASDVDGLREVVKDAGILFSPGNENELAKIINELACNKDYYNATTDACIKRAEKFDISKMADGYCKIYHTLSSV